MKRSTVFPAICDRKQFDDFWLIKSHSTFITITIWTVLKVQNIIVIYSLIKIRIYRCRVDFCVYRLAGSNWSQRLEKYNEKSEFRGVVSQVVFSRESQNIFKWLVKMTLYKGFSEIKSWPSKCHLSKCSSKTSLLRKMGEKGKIFQNSDYFVVQWEGDRIW